MVLVPEAVDRVEIGPTIPVARVTGREDRLVRSHDLVAWERLRRHRTSLAVLVPRRSKSVGAGCEVAASTSFPRRRGPRLALTVAECRCFRGRSPKRDSSVRRL